MKIMILMIKIINKIQMNKPFKLLTSCQQSLKTTFEDKLTAIDRLLKKVYDNLSNKTDR